MDFRILGALEVRDDGRLVGLGGSKQRALLAILLLHRNEVVSVDQLIDELWGESPPTSALRTLQAYVSRLRKALGRDGASSESNGGVLLTRGHGYLLRVGPAELDLDRFSDRAEQGRDALAAGNPQEAANLLREALKLWRGPPLADFAYDPFAQMAIAHGEERRLAALEERIEADLALGRARELVGELRDLVARHPLRERPRAQLMLALYRSGRQAEALETYRELRRHLCEELGLEPGAAVQQLELAILNRDRGLELGVSAAPPEEPMRASPERLRKSRPVRRPTGGGKVRFCSAPDGARIAYAIHGSGAPLVRVGTWLTHLELDWESPVWRHWLDGLGASHTVLRFDERGCGLSDSEVGELSVETWVGDLEAVVDAAGFERFVLLGVSQGAAIGVEYAARHADRISDLVLYGGFARGRLARGQVKQQEALVASIRAGWSAEDPAFRRVFTALFLPEGTREQMAWYEELMRVTTTAEAAARLVAARGAVDVIRTAPKVISRTLVMHSRNDHMVPVEEGRLLARLIPNAGFVLLDSPNHILLAQEPAWEHFLSELSRFLGTANRAAGSTPAAKLDARELEVLELVASGLDDEAIAERAGVGVETVQERLSSIYTELRLTGNAARTAAAVWFTEARIASGTIER